MTGSNLHQSTGAGGCNDVPARHLELHHHPVVDEQQHPAVDDEQQGHGTRRSLPCMLPILLNVEPSKWKRKYSFSFHCYLLGHLIILVDQKIMPIVAQATIGIHSDIASAQSCQLLCVETEDCVAFSWHFGSDQFDENTCQLFSGLLSRNIALHGGI